MKLSELEDKYLELKSSEFLKSHEFNFLDTKITFFIKEVNDEFGYNDGEPLDEDGIKFITTLLEIKWKLGNNIFEEE